MNEYLLSIVSGQRQGWRESCVKSILFLLSVFYQWIVAGRKMLYAFGVLKKNKIDAKVISVGNITTGGVGKTPFVIFLSKYIKAQGLKPVILTRGFMGKDSQKKGIPSDEVKMIQEVLPDVSVLVGASRYENAQQYLQKHTADIFLVEDGFQRIQLKRDLDIVLIDSAHPWGYGYLLPRGLLREPIGNLSRADVFVLTKTDLGKDNIPSIIKTLRQVNPTADIIETIHRPVELKNVVTNETKPIDFLKEKDVGILCGIGDPQSFCNTVRNLGAHVKKEATFVDHYVYSEDDIKAIGEMYQNNNVAHVVTTHKDAVKLKELLACWNEKINLYVLEVQMQITKNEGGLFERINHTLHN